jgi:hypothetical protein
VRKEIELRDGSVHRLQITACFASTDPFSKRRLQGAGKTAKGGSGEGGGKQLSVVVEGEMMERLTICGQVGKAERRKKKRRKKGLELSRERSFAAFQTVVRDHRADATPIRHARVIGLEGHRRSTRI